MSVAQANLSVGLLEGKYLTFALSEEKYGLQILKVQEIIGLMHITQVPQSPHYIKGVINLRGKIIPVVDLRLKFEINEIPYDEKTCIIVVECVIGGKHLSVGAVVDTVLEVMTFEGAKIEPSPDYGHSLETGFILGMGRTLDDQVIILIDIDAALYDAAHALGVSAQTNIPVAAEHH